MAMVLSLNIPALIKRTGKRIPPAPMPGQFLFNRKCSSFCHVPKIKLDLSLFNLLSNHLGG